MKKKILALILCTMMAATAVVGGTLAYFTDTDAAKNVMTTGNVKIVQNEKERPIDETTKQPLDNANTLTDFTQEKPLYPAVFYNEDGSVIAPDGVAGGDADVPTHGLVEINNGENGDVNGDENNLSAKLLDKSIANEVDKIVSVTNKGSRPVYARTIFLMENANLNDDKQLSDYVVKMWTANGGNNSGYYNVLSGGNLVEDTNVPLDLVEVEDGTYSVYVHYYENPVQPEKTTAASLKQIYLDPNATNEVSDVIGDEYTILALSQAVQTDGFTDDRAALNAAFGDVTADNCKTWFAELAKQEAGAWDPTPEKTAEDDTNNG